MKKVILLFVSFSFSYGQFIGEDDGKTHWGVNLNFSPQSEPIKNIKTILKEKENVYLPSNSLEIGIARGKTLSGDWGINFYQRTFNKGSLGSVEWTCGLPGKPEIQDCYQMGRKYEVQKMNFRGISLYKYSPFATIKKKAQLGLTVGIGASKVDGEIEKNIYDIKIRSRIITLPNPDPRGAPIIKAETEIIPWETNNVIPANEIFLKNLKYMPVWRLELTGALIIAPGLKMKVNYGINWFNCPSLSFSLLYLVGAGR